MDVAPNPTAFNVNSVPPGTVSDSAVLSAGGSSFTTALPVGTCFVVSAQSPGGGDFRYAARWNQPDEVVSGESHTPTASSPFTTESDFFRSCSADGGPFTFDLGAGSQDVTVRIQNSLSMPPINHQAVVSGGGSWTSPSLPVGSCWTVSVVSASTTAFAFAYDASW